MKNDIKHSGRVISINRSVINVAIIDRSMCSECNAKGICAASESKIKTIEVKNRFKEGCFSIGEEVDVIMRLSMGMKAVMLSYVFPLIIVMILLLSLPNFNINELFSGLIALGAVGLYYFILYMCRNRISGIFDFTIEKKQ